MSLSWLSCPGLPALKYLTYLSNLKLILLQAVDMSQIENEVKSMESPLLTIGYTVCALAGLVGAVKVIGKFQNNDWGTRTTAYTWLSSAVLGALAIKFIKTIYEAI